MIFFLNLTKGIFITFEGETVYLFFVTSLVYSLWWFNNSVIHENGANT